MNVTAYAINAFAKTENGGNGAGVVLRADALTEDQMLEIARRMGFSETAFVMESPRADCRVRFFTPAGEVELCGHATVGTFCLLAQKGLLSPGQYTQETLAGVLSVSIQPDGSVMMEQKRPQFFETVDRALIADSLQIAPEDLHPGLEPQIVSTGLRDVMVPVRSRAVLDTIAPDFGKVAEVSRRFQTVGYHLFALDTLYGDTACCRNLAPLYDIPEEAATGTSSGALACYLASRGQLKDADVRNLVFEQGYSMGRPSEIRVSLTLLGQEIVDVRVGGVSRGLRQRTIELA